MPSPLPFAPSRDTYPEKSPPLLKPQVERHIDERNRSAYAEAATYLTMIRTVYQALKGKAEWQEYITKIKMDYKNLPALQDELRKAKL